MHCLPVLVLIVLAPTSNRLLAQSTFVWPAGNRVAVRLTFDDALASQVLMWMDLFARNSARVTFYVNQRSMEKN